MRIITLLTVFLLSAPVANASLLRFDFAGSIVASFPSGGPVVPSPISGFVIIDAAVPDERPAADNARYPGAVVDGRLDWNGDFRLVPNAFNNDVFVLNDNDLLDDFFATTSSFEDAAGNLLTVFLQLGDSSRSVFADDSLPSALSLAMFDAFQLDNASGTGIFISPPGQPALQGGFMSATLRPWSLPVPPTSALFGIALLAWGATRATGRA